MCWLVSLETAMLPSFAFSAARSADLLRPHLFVGYSSLVYRSIRFPSESPRGCMTPLARSSSISPSTLAAHCFAAMRVENVAHFVWPPLRTSARQRPPRSEMLAMAGLYQICITAVGVVRDTVVW